MKLARGLDLRTEAVTQTFGFIGRKGSGKTYAASKLAELLFQAGAPFVAIDPVGTWWALRLAANGKDPGLSVAVLGGDHGDAPLPATAGTAVANIVLDKRVALVLDVSSFRKAERNRFVQDFAEELFHRAKSVRRPLMVFLEEAQKFAPQMAKGNERVLGAIEDIVRLGRNYGLGATLITQRPQSVNKEVLNQVECLFVGQLNGAHERKAIEQWIVANADEAELDTRLLPHLAVGDMFVWSPQWLKVFKQVHILKKKTYDASSTPTLSKRRERLGPLADVDIQALLPEDWEAPLPSKTDAQMSTRIAELERQLQVAKLELSKRPALPFDWTMLHKISQRLEEDQQMIDHFTKLCAKTVDPMTPSIATHEEKDRPARGASQTRQGPQMKPSANGALGKAPRLLLTALAQHLPRKLSAKQCAIFACYSPKSSTVANAISALRGHGYVMGPGKRLEITRAGIVAVGQYERLRSGPQLAEAWYSKLNKAERSMLQVLVDGGERLTKDELADRTGYSPSSSTVANALSKLRSLALIEGTNRDGLVAAEELRKI